MGRVLLIGAGPGPPDLLTFRAAAAIASADAIVYDDLGPSEEAVNLHARPDAEHVYVGKRGGVAASAKQSDIDALLVARAQAGQTVARLKGGDVAVFGRAGSELRALRAAGVPVEIVPGVSSALAAPLLAGFPLTDAKLSRGFAVTSGHDVAATDWQAYAAVDTLVLLMAGAALAEAAERLIAAGRAPDTPVAVVRSAGVAGQQRVWRAALATVAGVTAGEELSPCVVVIGAVAAEGAFGPPVVSI